MACLYGSCFFVFKSSRVSGHPQVKHPESQVLTSSLAYMILRYRLSAISASKNLCRSSLFRCLFRTCLTLDPRLRRVYRTPVKFCLRGMLSWPIWQCKFLSPGLQRKRIPGSTGKILIWTQTTLSRIGPGVPKSQVTTCGMAAAGHC